MKRCLSLTLCMLIFLSANAYAGGAYDTWAVRITDVKVTYANRTVELNPTIELLIGSDTENKHAWIQGSVCIDDETPIVVQVEYDEGVIRYSPENEQDCVVIEDGDHLLSLYSKMAGLESDIDIKTALTPFYSLLESPDDVERLFSTIPGDWLTIKQINPYSYTIDAVIDGISVQFQLSWGRTDAKDKPFTLVDKHAVKFNAKDGIFSNNDFMEALEAGRLKLAAEESMIKLILLYRLDSLENDVDIDALAEAVNLEDDQLMIKHEGDAMLPTLQSGDFLVYQREDTYDIGDVVIMRFDQRYRIGRIIALGGDWVDIDAETGRVKVNDKQLEEPYVEEFILGRESYDYPVQIPAGCMFIMGDNRPYANDSRNPDYGMPREAYIVGRVCRIVLPLDRACEIE